MRVFIKSLTGKTLELDVELDDSTNNLFSKIEDKWGIPQISQKLIVNGKYMEFGKQLQDYGIEQDTVIGSVVSHRTPVYKDGKCIGYFHESMGVFKRVVYESDESGSRILGEADDEDGTVEACWDRK
eukprot:TRINITY_DN112839_c0_g1_i1.p1 TRINITY_DN112839_c0_g1~~TRINITY_DN112839_c0_g1_i1.p1  ORF type:complete len:127 (+),score=20.27 TRINITY_DN112839_c0_g1_i1:79-459(+)